MVAWLCSGWSCLVLFSLAWLVSGLPGLGCLGCSALPAPPCLAFAFGSCPCLPCLGLVCCRRRRAPPVLVVGFLRPLGACLALGWLGALRLVWASVWACVVASGSARCRCMLGPMAISAGPALYRWAGLGSPIIGRRGLVFDLRPHPVFPGHSQNAHMSTNIGRRFICVRRSACVELG